MTTDEFEHILDADILNQLQGFAMLLNVPFETLLEEAKHSYEQVGNVQKYELDLNEAEYDKIELISRRTGVPIEQIARWIVLETLERIQEYA